MKSQAATRPSPGLRSRQPLLWAALVYAAGIAAGVHIWRPPLWWLVAETVFALAAVYFLRRRALLARCLGLCALFVIGALTVQVRTKSDPGQTALLSFTSGEEVTVTAHVTHEGNKRGTTFDQGQQVLDVETEQISSEGKTFDVAAGLRINVYNQEEKPASEAGAAPRFFHYGERIHFPVKLSEPRNFRNPGAFDYVSYLADKGIAALGSTKAANVEKLPGFAGGRLEFWRNRVHASIVQKVHTLWPKSQAGLIDAMVLGEDAFINRDARVGFQRSGTYHVLVVSGMNVGILALSILWTLRRLRINTFAASLVTVALTVGYAFLTDVGPPVWRATLMLAIFLATRLIYRDRAMLNALGAAALGLLIVDPQALLGASFQLTFLCVLLIAAVAIPILERTTQPYSHGLRHLNSLSYDVTLPPRVTQFRLDVRMVARRLERFAGKRFPLPALSSCARAVLSAGEILAVSAIMQVGLALPMAYYFHRATVVGLPANMLVVPLTGIMMPSAVLAVALGYISPLLARAPALLAGLSLNGITGTVYWLGGLRIADTRVSTPALAVIFLSAAALAISMLAARRQMWITAVGLLALAASAFWICAVPPHPHLQAGVLEITAVDVGQGDCLLLVSPDGRTLLIDAGGFPFWMHSQLDIGEDVVSPYLWSRGIARLNAVAITHPHADHIGGMSAVLANFHPLELWLGDDSPSPELDRLRHQADTLGVKIVRHTAGDSFAFGDATIRVLAPEEATEGSAPRPNDASLVIKVSYGSTSALLEGDAERKEEHQISEEQPQADILKVAHHGSATSTQPELLESVHPRFAVISVGTRNVYGHPRVEVLNRLEKAGVGTFRTDRNGAVTFYLDGKTVRPSTYLPGADSSMISSSPVSSPPGARR